MKGERGNGSEVAGVPVSNAECTEVQCWWKQRQSIWQWGGGHSESVDELLIRSPTPCLDRHIETHVRKHTIGNTYPLVTCGCWSLLHAEQLTQSDVFCLCLSIQSFITGHKHTLELMSCPGKKPQFNTVRSWLFRESPQHFNLPLPELKLSPHTGQRRLETQPYCTRTALPGHCVVFFFWGEEDCGDDKDVSFIFWWAQEGFRFLGFLSCWARTVWKKSGVSFHRQESSGILSLCFCDSAVSYIQPNNRQSSWFIALLVSCIGF